MFETPPYDICPECGEKSFGILLVKGDMYYRRCSLCKFPGSALYNGAFHLPKIQKKVFYLDQFVYSNFVNLYTNKKFKHKDFFKEFYRKITKLYNLQAIVCPYSDSHDDESSFSKINSELKKEYQKFSSDLQFESYLYIKKTQLISLSSLWICNNLTQDIVFDNSKVIDGRINAWNDKFHVSINRTWPTEWVNSDRKIKLTLQKMAADLYSKYKDYKHDPFEECYNDEKMAYGKNIITIFIEYARKNPFFCNPERITPPDPVSIVVTLYEHFCSSGIPESESILRVFEFLCSDVVSNLPFIKIPALIYASIARKIKNGMRQPIDPGTPEDTTIISHLIPYCDAMFIDNKMHSIIQENPVKSRIGFATKLFSLNTQDKLLEYLDDIEKNLSEEQITYARMLYFAQ